MTDKEIEKALEQADDKGLVLNEEINCLDVLDYINCLKEKNKAVGEMNDRLFKKLGEVLSTVNCTNYLNGEKIEQIKEQTRKETAKEVSYKIKEILFANLKTVLNRNSTKLHPNNLEDYIGMVKVICYQINRLVLNDGYGLDEPLNACNQFLAEKELVQKYGIEVKYDK